MATVIVVYAVASKVIRRVFVSDGGEDIPVALVSGEAQISIAPQVYAALDALSFREHVAGLIGPPTKPDRCVEIDATGKAVAVYAADPDIDKPLFGKSNTLELHTDVVVGDRKADGRFPPKAAKAVSPDIGFGAT